jgi:hypothetical protein
MIENEEFCHRYTPMNTDGEKIRNDDLGFLIDD